MPTKQATTRRSVPTAAAMRALGRSYARLLVPGAILLLEGSLGSGKTTFVQGLAKGLGIAHPIVSPTFALRKRYSCPRGAAVAALNHCDAYRMESAEELQGLLEDHPQGKHEDVWVIEWGGKVRDALPRSTTLRFAHARKGRTVAGLPVLHR